jgi:hypothetical protein
MSASGAAVTRIAMWSGPRNVSTAMMRAFENRADAVVIDEPFYGAYLAETGLEHPMREAIIEACENDPSRVAAMLLGPTPDGTRIFYQKHMTHHMRPSFGLRWMHHVSNAFLIRAPEAVLASYAAKRADVTLADIGAVQQAELFDIAAERLGAAPPVVLGADVATKPRETLGLLCAALGVSFDEAMLSWPAGRRDSDGVWAEHWYGAVEASTGFHAPAPEPTFEDLPDHLKPIAEAARPHFERLERYKLAP